MFQLSYEQLRLKMAGASYYVGIIAIISSVTLAGVFFIPIGLGCLAILLGILARGYNTRFKKPEKTGIILGSIAIAIGVLICAYSIYTVINNPDELKTILESADSLYGADYEEVYGKNVSEMFNELFGDSIK